MPHKRGMPLHHHEKNRAITGLLCLIGKSFPFAGLEQKKEHYYILFSITLLIKPCQTVSLQLKFLLEHGICDTYSYPHGQNKSCNQVQLY